MGRGLSELQKKILVVALDRKAEIEKLPPKGKEHEWGCVFFGELFARIYGWIPTRAPIIEGKWSAYDGCYNRGSYHFDSKKIGQTKYNTGRAAMSRAVRRLENRKLVKTYGGWIKAVGVALTPAGIAAANEAREEMRLASGAES